MDDDKNAASTPATPEDRRRARINRILGHGGAPPPSATPGAPPEPRPAGVFAGAAARPASAFAPVTVRYAGGARELFPLYLITLLLTFVTLGIYRFWARTRMRRHIWEKTHVMDEPLEYTGTGGELFMGFLKAVAALLPLFILSFAIDMSLAGLDPERDMLWLWIGGLAKAALYLVLFYLVWVGIYAGLAYRTNRTRWRNIRFRQAGAPWRYALTAFWGYILVILTLGLFRPILDARLARYQAENRYFGDRKFEFANLGGALFRPFLKCWLLLIPTLGFSYFWYVAHRARAIAESTTLGRLSFSYSEAVSGWRVLRLLIGNALIALVSAGLLYPVVVRRTMRFWCDNLVVSGPFEPSLVRQTGAVAGSGEGLEGFFNVGDTLGG